MGISSMMMKDETFGIELPARIHSITNATLNRNLITNAKSLQNFRTNFGQWWKRF